MHCVDKIQSLFNVNAERTYNNRYDLGDHIIAMYGLMHEDDYDPSDRSGY
jgi:hypothetical protein